MQKVFIAAALFATLAGAHAAPNLVANGSFEAQSQAAGTWNVYASMSGWTTVSGSGIEVRNNVSGTAFDGQNFVELDSYANSAMAQTVATVGGSHYTLSFAYSPRFGTAASTNPIQVSWNGASLATVTADGSSNSGNVWTSYSYDVIGTGRDTLTFAAVGTSDSLGGGLDAVSLTAAVPEPSTYAMMVGGLGLLTFAARRRHTKR